MTRSVVAIIFGGASPENRESLRAAQILYRHAIKGILDQRYRFRYFYLTPRNGWVTESVSERIVRGEFKRFDPRFPTDSRRILELKRVDAIYSTMMGTAGENGNIMGLADLFNVPIIGCDIKASALTLDKHLCKVLANSSKSTTIPTGSRGGLARGSDSRAS
jgi:D-alanine-D-alanine ligase